mmetsp:Transcript_8475/g.15975  ORF Transcript_8475/g.15975 Transcript_8475/m.15975 type:complete len:454 (+) Transcript_8475:136-1497(+)|eukprot:CAMPEP_0176496850 /NCGR_PEP_ID=MMETSP0200_2-20121128/11410_1 /TAXON_ID=947934 /ORGANISM="Chaetoceros sp., Strain GSL56" /LENGTH=453 /DNA_ID=CAMNT_0017894823 /DNA_START=23 /DNA_END=1384 /DNA_ORIENTATION=-
MAGNKKKKTSSKKKNATKKFNQTNSFAPASPQDIHQILAQADTFLESSNLENALQLYFYAANELRRNVQEGSTKKQQEGESNVLLLSKVLGKLAEVKVSMGDQQGAQRDFLEAVNLLNGDGPIDNGMAKAQWREARASLYLYLGQLSSSNDALEAFTRAIHDLKDCLGLLQDQVRSHAGDATIHSFLAETRSQLCGAYCSVAELYLTDLCFEPNAEHECESSLKAALELDEPTSSPDAVQAMANLRLSQNRGSEAVSLILEAYSRVKVGCEALADLVGLGVDKDMEGEIDNGDDDNAKLTAMELKGEALDAANALPGFEFRCQMAKLLLECAFVFDDDASSLDKDQHRQRKKQCVESAIQVLGSLLAENDEVIEIWFLLGCAFSSTDPKNNELAKYYLETALEMLEKLKRALKNEMQSEEIKAEISDVNQKIKDVTEKIKSIDDMKDSEMQQE